MPEQAEDERLERLLGRVLRVGVVLSALALVLGGGFYLVEHSLEVVPDRSKFSPGAPHSPAERAILLGLFVLIATPVVRVVVCVVHFARRRDLAYFLFGVIVLAVLLVGLFGRLG